MKGAARRVGAGVGRHILVESRTIRATKRVPVGSASRCAPRRGGRRRVSVQARRRSGSSPGDDVSTEASCRKLFASEMCERVADRAVQIFGGSAYIAEHGIERFYRDSRLFRLACTRTPARFSRSSSRATWCAKPRAEAYCGRRTKPRRHHVLAAREQQIRPPFC